MENTPELFLAEMEEIPSITIPQEKYDRLIAAEAKLKALAALIEFIPSYDQGNACKALLVEAEDPDPAAKQNPFTETATAFRNLAKESERCSASDVFSREHEKLAAEKETEATPDA